MAVKKLKDFENSYTCQRRDAELERTIFRLLVERFLQEVVKAFPVLAHRCKIPPGMEEK